MAHIHGRIGSSPVLATQVSVMDTKEIGDISELTAMLYFKRRGIPVLIPYGDNEKYDFVIDINGIFYRVQVKTATRPNDSIIVLRGRRSTYKKKEGRGRLSANYIGKADLFAACYKEDVWLIPVNEVGTSGSMHLRLVPPKDKINRKNIKWAEDYTFDKQFNKLIAKGS